MSRVFGFVFYADGDAVVEKIFEAIQSVESFAANQSQLPFPVAKIDQPALPATPVADQSVDRTSSPVAKPRKVRATDSAQTEITDTTNAFLRAVANTDGRPASIRAATGKQDIGYHLTKLIQAGLVRAEGATLNRRYVLADKAKPVNNGAKPTPAASGLSWSIEQRQLLRFLKNRGGSARADDIRQELHWSDSVFDRAVDRRDFNIVGNVVSIA